MPTAKPRKLAVAFVCFHTSPEALNAVGICNGLVDVEVTPSPGGLTAHIGLDNGSFFLYQNFRSLESVSFRTLDP